MFRIKIWLKCNYNYACCRNDPFESEETQQILKDVVPIKAKDTESIFQNKIFYKLISLCF